ncbi:helix-turn-helix domain-containing protein [Nocardia sp. NPDC101769]|uniref:helix-turn-helix domain-containing protein n=1 Tax=Nocardia sp. NPDC101769 TaxID=3364333 RepID=UPI00382949FA
MRRRWIRSALPSPDRTGCCARRLSHPRPGSAARRGRLARGPAAPASPSSTTTAPGPAPPALYLHVDTVHYRIERIERMTGRDLSRLDDRIHLRAALMTAGA